MKKKPLIIAAVIGLIVAFAAGIPVYLRISKQNEEMQQEQKRSMEQLQKVQDKWDKKVRDDGGSGASPGTVDSNH